MFHIVHPVAIVDISVAVVSIDSVTTLLAVLIVTFVDVFVCVTDEGDAGVRYDLLVCSIYVRSI